MRVAARGEMHADAAGAPHRDHSVRHFEHEARAVLDRAAVAVGSLVAAVLQELVQKVAVRAVNLDAVEARCLGVLCAPAKGLDDSWQFCVLERPRDDVGPLGTQEAHPALRRDGARRYRERAIVVARVGDASHMPQLKQDPAAGPVHGLGDRAPAVDLFLRPDARRMRIADAHRRHRRRLGDDHARRGALDIIIAHHRVWHAARAARAVAGQRRHEDAVGQAKIANGDRVKQRRHVRYYPCLS